MGVLPLCFRAIPGGSRAPATAAKTDVLFATTGMSLRLGVQCKH